MIGQPFFARRLAVAGLLAAAFICGFLPGRAEASFAQWAIPPEVGGRDGAKEANQALPGWVAAPASDHRIKTFQPSGPRAFGRLTGDKVRHHLLIELARPYRLQRSSLPPAGWLATWLELQDVQVAETGHDEVTRYVIALDYQIFATPRTVTLDMIPGFVLRFAGKGESFPLTVPDWRFSISPLLKPEPEAEAVAKIPLRADAPPPLADSTTPGYALALFGGLSALFGTCWLYLKALWPFGRRGKTPFARACRALRGVKPGNDPELALRIGFRIVHQAFNQTAGEVVFAEHLERFFKARPTFASCRAAIEVFYAKSREMFFAGARPETAGVGLGWLAAVCRQCRAAEREAR